MFRKKKQEWRTEYRVDIYTGYEKLEFGVSVSLNGDDYKVVEKAVGNGTNLFFDTRKEARDWIAAREKELEELEQEGES